MTTRIIGTGSSIPNRKVTNDDLAKIMDTSDEWIYSRTGIHSRHLVEQETTTGMASDAAQKAMENAGVSPEEIDLIIVGSVSGDMCYPSTACLVQAKIGAVNAVAYDISAGCSGFLFALNTAHAYIQSGIYQCALVIGAETLSKMMDWNDRSTCVLFGDGAGAAIVKANNAGIRAITQHSDGAGGDVLVCSNRGSNNPFVTSDTKLDYTKMEGQEVFKFAVKMVPKCVQEVIEKAGLSVDDVDYFLLHQANKRIIESVSKRLKVSLDKFPTNIEHYGNTSAASIPILLDELNRKNTFQKGDIIVMSGFGAGLTWGATLLEW